MKKITVIGLAALLAVAVLIGVVAYNYLKPAQTASEPIQAVSITPAGSAANTVYTIDQASSKATFTIDEVLNGAPKTVVGTTDQVAGEIAVNATAPSTAQIGTIQINAHSRARFDNARFGATSNNSFRFLRHD